MTDRDRADRLAAIRSRQGLDPLLPPAAPAASRQRTTPAPRTRRSHPAMGARIIASGLTASAVLGLTTVIAAASRPSHSSAAATLPPVEPATSTPPTTTTPVPPSLQTVVLTVPALNTAPAPTAAPATPAPAPATPAPAPATPAPRPVSTAPRTTPAPAPAPPPTAAPAPPPTPPPPATTKPSGA